MDFNACVHAPTNENFLRPNELKPLFKYAKSVPSIEKIWEEDGVSDRLLSAAFTCPGSKINLKKDKLLWVRIQ